MPTTWATFHWWGLVRVSQHSWNNATNSSKPFPESPFQKLFGIISFPPRLPALDCRIAVRVSAKEMVVREMVGKEVSIGSSASPWGTPASAHCTCAKCCAYTSALLSVQSSWPCPDPCKRRTFCTNGFLRLVIGCQSPVSSCWSSHSRLLAFAAVRICFVSSLTWARSPCSRSLPLVSISARVSGLIQGFRGLCRRLGMLVSMASWKIVSSASQRCVGSDWGRCVSKRSSMVLLRAMTCWVVAAGKSHAIAGGLRGLAPNLRHNVTCSGKWSESRLALGWL